MVSGGIFMKALTTVGVGLLEASVEVPVGFCLGKKGPIASVLFVGSKASRWDGSAQAEGGWRE